MKFVISFPDPLFGYIKATDIEKTIIDFSEFQRLKRIKQLGVANVVFPGALHTRFEHSLGVMHIAGLIFNEFREEFGDKFEIYWQKIRLAGLLHDIGHSPFSHTFELAFKRIKKIKEIQYRDHEANTRFIISNFGKRNILKTHLKKCGILEDSISYFKTIGNIATGKTEHLHDRKDKFLSSIISGEIDADRLDYLMRDGLHTGVNFIGFNFHQILENLSMCTNKDKLIIGKKGNYRSFHEKISISLGEAILTSRYHHYIYLVNHPRNISADLMIIKAFKNALDNYYNKSGEKEYKKKINSFYIDYDDNDFLNFIEENGDFKSKDMINSLKNGKLLCFVSDLKSNALKSRMKLCLEMINRNPIVIEEIEEEINKLLHPQQIMLSTTSIKGIPKNLRIRLFKKDGFLYDDSKVAAGLIMEILGSYSLYFLCDTNKDLRTCDKKIKKNWKDIENIFISKMNDEREKKPFRLDFLLLFLNEFNNLVIRKNKDIGLHKRNPSIYMFKYITRVYKMMKWIQYNYPRKYGNAPNPLNYNFTNEFGFLYSPDLFEDIMRLGSLRLIKIIINEKDRTIYDYGIRKGYAPLDYISTRSHNYYKFYVFAEGGFYCNFVKKKYPEYMTLLKDNLEYLYSKIYNKD